MIKKIFSISIVIMMVFLIGVSVVKSTTQERQDEQKNNMVYKKFKDEVKKLPEYIRRPIIFMLYEIIVYINDNEIPQTPQEGSFYVNDVYDIIVKHSSSVGIHNAIVSVDYPIENQYLYVDLLITISDSKYVIFSVRFDLKYYKSIKIPDSFA